MYCPNCEFEIKQGVTECPICGGELTLHPEENPGSQSQPADREAEDIPLDLSISNLILDAKQELDALDSMPVPAVASDEPEPSRLDLEALLSQDADENPPPFPDAPFEQAMSAISPEEPGGHDIFALPDNDLFRETAGSPFFEAGSPAEQYPCAKEAGVPEQPFLLEDSLFIDETSPNTAPPDSAPFIDEASGQRLASALDSMAAPHPRPDAGPGLTFGRDMSEPAAGGLDFDPEARQQSDAATPDPFVRIDNEKPEFSLDGFAATPEPAGAGSKFRLIALALLGVVIIAGTYVLADYFLKKNEPTEQIAKPVAPAVPKKTKPAEQKPAPASDAPAVLAEQSAPASGPDVTPKAPTPDQPYRESAMPQAVREPAAEPQPAPSTPEHIRTAPAAGQTRPPKTIATDQKSETAAAPAKSTPVIAANPDKKAAPATRVFSVHVFSFKTQQAAQVEIDRLNKRGFDAYLETVDLGAKGTWHRVKVGHYATRDAAEQARRDIKNKYPGIEPQLHMR